MSTNSDSALVAVEEIHAFVCGCERPGDADNGCVAEPPFAFRVLTGEEIGRVYTQRFGTGMSTNAETNQRVEAIRRAISALLAQDSWQEPLCIEAVQSLDALLAEIERLRAENARLWERLERPGEYDLFDPEWMQG